jgi:hypothetical protein
MEIKVGFCGYFRAEVIKPNGSVIEVVPVQKNLILDQGIDNFKDAAGGLSYCHIGSGQTVPQNTQVGLETPVAVVAYKSKSDYNPTNAPYYTDTTIVFEFAAGTFIGEDLHEIGVGGSGASSLFSRTLVKDPLGALHKINVLSDEILRVVYTLRLNIPDYDMIDVVGGYTFTARAGNSNVSTYWSLEGNGDAALTPATFNIYANASLGGIVEPMSGTSLGSFASSGSRPTTKSYRQVCTLGVDSANHANGVSGILLVSSTFRLYLKILITPAIMKTEYDQLRFEFDIAWDRAQ